MRYGGPVMPLVLDLQSWPAALQVHMKHYPPHTFFSRVFALRLALFVTSFYLPPALSHHRVASQIQDIVIISRWGNPA